MFPCDHFFVTSKALVCYSHSLPFCTSLISLSLIAPSSSPSPDELVDAVEVLRVGLGVVRRVDGASGVHDASVARRPCGPWDEGDG